MKKDLIICISLMMMAGCGEAGSLPLAMTDTHSNPLEVDEFSLLINNHRISVGLRPLNISPLIEEVALEHSEAMARQIRNFGHWGFQDRCSKISAAFGRVNRCGENVAKGQSNAKAVFRSWMNSPAHRKNIEEGAYTHTGLGRHQGSDGSVYWTHLFLEVR